MGFFFFKSVNEVSACLSNVNVWAVIACVFVFSIRISPLRATSGVHHSSLLKFIVSSTLFEFVTVCVLCCRWVVHEHKTKQNILLNDQTNIQSNIIFDTLQLANKKCKDQLAIPLNLVQISSFIEPTINHPLTTQNKNH